MGPNDTIARCPYCSGSLYRLGGGMMKCAACRKKFSPAKLRRDYDVIARFCHGETAREASMGMGISYQSVTARYARLRLLAAAHLEAIYEAQRDRVSEFEEYIYLEPAKRRDKRHIFDAHNFITFDYGGKVYNLPMPSLRRYKREFPDKALEKLYCDEFNRFLRIHHIAKLKKNRNTITAFWDFFEHYVSRYKGVKPENFPYYLKEAEFRFNYDAPDRIEILTQRWLCANCAQ